MSIITLTSDFGLVDHRVASIKGAILSLNLESKIVDITHQIQAYNLLQAAYIVRNSYRHFPLGSIHIISVDSFYSKHRKSILYKVDGHYFIASDNGILSLLFFDITPEAIYEINFTNRFDDEITFTTTDIFVPAAVHLQKGGLPEIIGKKMKNPKQLSFTRAVFNESEKIIAGEAMYIDNFGNVVSNISKKFFDKTKANFKSYQIKFRNISLTKIDQQYTDIVTDWKNEHDYHGKPVAIFNEAEMLELSIYKGSSQSGARSLFGLKIGEKIYIQFS